jgi:hypothetical protein
MGRSNVSILNWEIDQGGGATIRISLPEGNARLQRPEGKGARQSKVEGTQESNKGLILKAKPTASETIVAILSRRYMFLIEFLILGIQLITLETACWTY